MPLCASCVAAIGCSGQERSKHAAEGCEHECGLSVSPTLCTSSVPELCLKTSVSPLVSRLYIGFVGLHLNSARVWVLTLPKSVFSMMRTYSILMTCLARAVVLLVLRSLQLEHLSCDGIKRFVSRVFRDCCARCRPGFRFINDDAFLFWPAADGKRRDDATRIMALHVALSGNVPDRPCWPPPNELPRARDQRAVWMPTLGGSAAQT